MKRTRTNKAERIKLPRAFWTRNPATRIKPSDKALASKRACRKWKFQAGIKE
ncbi:MAG TPA: hypothetical protein PLN69_08925 [bacterium]|nr:hypothetical protein [bacterium]